MRSRRLAALAALAVLWSAVAACTSAPSQEPQLSNLIGVGPLQPPPVRPFADLVADDHLPAAVRARIVAIDPVRWHDGESIRYPYCLVHLAVDHGWRQPVPDDLAVRIFGGVEGDRKYVSAIQPDPVTLRPGMELLLFVSPPAQIDPGVTAATVEELFFVDGDTLLRFDRTAADVTVTQAVAALNAAETG
ncbi:hypothetical protein Cs7R123_60220 [Catellatospora sp. TT07R-123]|uniref:hypothetical protein n=1 Tax=Catellatospora sp. TT07R-123 TaxID=2733863 RepID=UPI001B03D34B|nr:hypothetical protein [Catellatospora sp. TT07R-123]GHJ48680.1 hypothetical protein Cs7R123_60220 [Catellatospora sp. TT07R-123]